MDNLYDSLAWEQDIIISIKGIITMVRIKKVSVILSDYVDKADESKEKCRDYT
jgi:hypothetical protein